MTDTKVAIHDLTHGLVVDKSVLASQSVDELAASLALIRLRSKRPIKVVETAASFFRSDVALEFMKVNDPTYLLIADKMGVTIRAEDVAAIFAAEELRKSIEASMIPPTPPYVFANVPDGWSIKTDLSIQKNFVRRRRLNCNHDGTSYQLSIKQLQRLWQVAGPFWQKMSTGYTVDRVTSGYLVRTAEISMTCILIGCQTIRRYELEQLAKHLNWPFPEQPAIK